MIHAKGAYGYEVPRGVSLTEVLLDDLEDLLVVKLLRNALNSGQGLATITLCGEVLARQFSGVA